MRPLRDPPGHRRADTIPHGARHCAAAATRCLHLRIPEEPAKVLKKPSEMQGAGLLNGDRLASAVLARVQAGVPVGNIADMLSVRLTSEQKKAFDHQTRFRMTPLGIVDTKTGRMIKTDEELFWLMKEIKKPIAIAYNREIPASTKNRNAWRNGPPSREAAVGNTRTPGRHSAWGFLLMPVDSMSAHVIKNTRSSP